MPKLVPQARAALTALALTGAVALLGCGQDTPAADSATAPAAASPETAGPSAASPGATAPAAATPEAEATGSAAASPLPAMTVTDVASGDEVPLADLLPADRPLLVWMWAPS